ncbi:MAG: hypothetical protein ACLP22_12930 [Solirubrobacteraceae bacterium]
MVADAGERRHHILPEDHPVAAGAGEIDASGSDSVVMNAGCAHHHNDLCDGRWVGGVADLLLCRPRGHADLGLQLLAELPDGVAHEMGGLPTARSDQRLVLQEFVNVLRWEAHNLTQRPDLLWQQLCNRLSRVLAVAYSPDGARIISSGVGMLWLWTRRPRSALRCGPAWGYLRCCDYSRQGTHICCGDDSGGVYILELMGGSPDHRPEARPFEPTRTRELSTDNTPEAVNRSTTTVATPGRRYWWSRR